MSLLNTQFYTSKPVKRSKLRRALGREYYTAKRRLIWLFGTKKYALGNRNTNLTHSVFHHQSMILRPLKDVDMQLQENKRTNLELAIKHLDGIIINPGETFSIWRLVGRPTKRKGYLPGLVLNQGRIESGTGGGLCQLGNLLFWIFAHSELTITERYRHSYDVFPDVSRTIPFGAGATLSYNYIDLQAKNNTENTFQLRLWMDKTHLHGELRSKEEGAIQFRVEERDHKIEQQIWGGYTRHNRIVQIAAKDGKEEERLLAENHAIMMYSPLLPK